MNPTHSAHHQQNTSDKEEIGRKPEVDSALGAERSDCSCAPNCKCRGEDGDRNLLL